jgi:hypothetical protein
MIGMLWVLYVAPVFFGLLIGLVALLIFVRLFSLSQPKKAISFFTWVASNSGVIVGAIKYLESIVSKQSSSALGATIAYSDFSYFVISYLGGYGIGGLIAITFYLRRIRIDQAFIDIFLPLRKEMSDQEIIALKLWTTQKPRSLIKRLISLLSRRPIRNPSQGMLPNEAAALMRISRQEYDIYLAEGMKKLKRYLERSP